MAKALPKLKPDKHAGERQQACDRFRRSVRLVADKASGSPLGVTAAGFANVVENESFLARPVELQGITAAQIIQRAVSKRPVHPVVLVPLLAEDAVPLWHQNMKGRLVSFSPEGGMMVLNYPLMGQCSSDVLIGVVGQHEMVHCAGHGEADAYAFEFGLLESIGGDRYARLLQGVIAYNTKQEQATGRSAPLPYNATYDFLWGGPPKSELEGKIRMSEVFMHAIFSDTIRKCREKNLSQEEIGKALDGAFAHISDS